VHPVSIQHPRVILFVGIALLVCASLLSVQPAYGSCSSPANPIEAENCLPGNPPSDWQINGSGDPTIQGFATDISVNAGQTINFKVNTDSTSYVVEIYRMGYYGGQGARRITILTPSVSLPQAQPACVTDNSTFLYDCGNWAVSASWQVPANATSGLYFAHLLRSDTGGDSHVFFVVRNDAGTSNILYQTSDLTWQAYNDYGGHSLYGDASEFNLPVRGLKVSYNRPSDTRNFEAATFLFNAEYPMIRWLEANGYDVSYFTGVDAVRNSSLILNHKVYLSSGHDEYWDATQRANIKAARDAGVNLAFFSGNEMFWKTRWENSFDGTNTPYRTLVCYKESYGDAVDPLDPPIWTGTWRDPTKSPPADGGQPENAITGTLFMVNGPGTDNTNLSIKVPQSDGQMRFWRNSSVANLATNQVATMPSGTLGYEWDVDGENSVRPAGLFYLSTATYTLTSDFLLDYGVTYGAGIATHHATMYRAPSGALVFGSGTVQWAWGLDSNHDGTITPAPDPNMQQATENLLADMGVQPATLQPGLQPASQSTDTTPPVSTITAPVAGNTVNVGTPVTVAGTATDAGGGVVAGVEVSTDGGQTWHPAVGRANWTYSWTPSVVGTAALMSRAVDDSANLENPQTSGGNQPGGVPVNVNPQICPCSIWNSSLGPNTVDGGDPSAIEVGVRFRTDNDGVITGLRFYKASTNTGAHIGHLWTSSGTLLGTVTFTGESSSGWQQVQFATPIAVTANTVYVASYFAPSGHYSADSRYFKEAGYDSPPMHALEDGVDGSDGVFIYTPTPGVFPTASFTSTNYWVDVVFVSGTTFEIGGNVGGIGGIGATVTLTGAANASTTTDSAGNYQFTGLVNGTYTITPSNLGVTFSPTAQTVTVNSLSLSNVNFGSVVTSPLNISGIITDGGGAGTVVSLSGVTSLSTTADSSGHYTFSGLIAGTYTVTPIQAGYIYTPNSQVVTLTNFSDTAVNFSAEPCPCITIWQPTAAPTVPDSGDPAGVEVGVKFRTDVAGTIQGLRFYKATKNTGTHIGHIWSNTGLLLGTATFTNESASGWQEVIFSPPVKVSGGTVYVASYFAPVGHYAFDTNYFLSAGVDNPPLHALANGVSGPDGVYTYGSAPAFPNNGVNGTNYWVDVVFAPSPPHNVSGTIAGAGGPGATITLAGGTTVSTTADASGNFSFPNTFDGTYVLSVSQTGFAFTASSQTVTVSGTDVNGLMFATLPNCIPCDSIWQITSAPTVADAGDPLSVNVGVKFRSDSDGEIAGLRFYKSALNTGTHVGTVWSSNGTLLGSVTFEDESQFGWQQALFPSPVPIAANTTYVVAYLAPSGHYAADSNYFATNGTDSPPLHALASGVDGQNGVFGYGSTIVFPSSSFQANNYWVDVIFTPTGSTHAISGTISGAGGPGATVTLGGAANGTVTADTSGNFSFGGLADGAYTVTPTQTGYAFNPGVQPVTVSGADVGGVNFGTVQNCPCNTIWPTSAVPTVPDGGDNVSVNLGVKFRADNDGYIVGLRFYKSPLNTGPHVGTLWSDAGTQLATATFTGESGSGWQQVLFDTAVPVSANTTYIASYLAPVGHYASDANYFTNNGVDNPPLHALMNGVDGGNAVFAYSSTTIFPNQSFQSANYWVDVIYAGTESYSIAGTIGGPGGPGATVILGGASSTTTTADASGNYSFGGLENGNYTITPVSNIYAFGPSSQSVTVSNGHVLNVNFTSGYGISGTISGPGGPGAAVTLTGPSSATTIANGSGNYSFTGLPNGTYAISASNSGYVFTPASQAATLNGASASGLNFTSVAQTYNVSGNIGGPGGPGATVSLAGASTAATTADGSGNYSFAGLANGSYTVTPSQAGFVYTPSGQAVTVNGANLTSINFTSVLQTYTISGTITGPGGARATVNLTGTSTAATTADGSGNYSFTGLQNGSYTVTPTNTGYVFGPSSQAVTISGSSSTASFTSTLLTYTISGTISGPGGPGATVNLTGAASASTSADGSGNFSFTGLLNGSYIVTPANAGFVFTPVSQIVVVNSSNFTGLSFATVSGCPTCNTIWPSTAAPTTADSGDPAATELGVKFRADSDGYVTGLQFYKASTNTGTHVAHLWTSTGTLLGTATFTSEGVAGWQQVLFASPIPVTANTTYVASYFAPAGHYAGDSNFFGTVGVDNPPLHALANGVDGPNGIYLYTTTGGFPTATLQATNYWVDVVFNTGQGYSIVGTITGPGSAGATVTLTGASTATTTTDASGNYSFNDLANGSYTVTPSNAGIAFTPASQTVTINSAHVMNVNFTATPQTYSISGTISGPGGAGATVNLTGTSTATTTADGSGNYSFTGLVNGSYTVTPNQAGFVYTPSGQAVTINGANLTAVNFTSAQVFNISGTISGPGGAGATVTLTGASTATTTADGSGNYSFTGLLNGSYTVTPSKSGFVFTPGSQAVTLNGANATVNFSSAQLFSLSGTISGPGGPGTTVSLTGASTATTTADGSGNYSFTGLLNGSYTVTPSKSGYIFSPVSQSVTISGANLSAVNFSSSVTVASLVISPASVIGGSNSSGTVTLSAPAPLGGTVVTLSSSNTAAAQVPATVTVAANATTATFTVTTSPVAANTSSTISATFGTTQTASLMVTAATLSSVTLNPTSVIGSTSSTGTVTLNGPAPSGGAVVSLSSSNPAAAQVPISVTVPPNATTATFIATTSPVPTTTSLTISGTYGSTQSASFTVTPPVLSSLSLNPTSVPGGASSGGTVTLNGPAPSGGAVVNLSSSNPAAQVPMSVTVAANATTSTFTVTTSAVTSNTTLTISGTYGSAQTSSFTVLAGALSTITLNPASVVGGTSSTGTVTLSHPAPTGGAVVTLSSSNTTAAQVLASVTVAANATTATFTVTTSPVASNTSLTISGIYGATKTANLTVTAPTMSAISVSPTSVIGGNSSTGRVTLNGPAPAGGASVTLSSNNTSAAQVPANVTVAGGATTATFTVTTSPVASTASVTITGVYGTTKTATLTVSAAALSAITISPASVLGGTPSTGTVTLNGPAPVGGAVVSLSSNNTSAAQVPASVAVAANATTATFTVTTSPVATNASVTVTGVYGAARTATLTVTAAVLSSMSLNPATVTGGNTSTGTVTLNGPAPANGAVVTLSSNNTSAAQVPSSVTVPANSTTATFTVTTHPVATATTATISATYGATKTAGLNVIANGVSSITMSPASVVGGTSSTGTVTLTRAAPTGGALVTLSSNNVAAAQVPASVTVPANATTATFTVTTSPLASNASVTISGTYETTKTITLTVTAATLSTVTLSPTLVIGGTSSTGTVTLNGPAPAGGAVVSLSSNNTGAAKVPASVTVAPNATTATFTVTTNPVATNTFPIISATYNATKTAVLTVAAPIISTLTLNPTTVKGPAPSTGTVTLSGPAPTGGAVVTLSSNLTSVATVPASVTVAAGNTSATFTVATKTVTTSSSVTISATKGGTVTASLTVTP
jgi:Domain of unknown function (DUF4082)/Bacterial Ig domain/Carboxypeptidase regulatory-like domain